MAVFNAAKREIDIKIVYYGPALCGKTTNVQAIHKKLAPDQRGDIMSLATKDDRTLFFDFLPIELGNVKGFKTRFHIYTVPGQVYYALTRRAVLTSVDGVVFVADSQREKMEENIESLNDLNENLAYYKKDLGTLPFVIQYNKRDLDNIVPVEELNAAVNTLHFPCFEAAAVSGQGVMETLTGCCKLVLKQLNQPSGKAKKPAAPAAVADEPVIKITQKEPAPEPAATSSVSEDPGVGGGDSAFDSDEPAISGEAGAPAIAIDTSGLSLDADDTRGTALDEQPIPTLDLDADAATADEPGAGSAVAAGEGLTIVACGKPRKASDTALKIPVILKIDELNRECNVTITLSFDDFTLK